MVPSFPVREWLIPCLRWLPPIGLTACVAGIGLLPWFRDLVVYYAGISSLTVLLAWTATAWIVSITAHQRFVRNLRGAQPRHAMIAAILVGLLLLLRHAISVSLMLVAFLLVHVSLAAVRPRLTLMATVLSATLTVGLVEGLFALPLSIPTLWQVPGFHTIALRRYWAEIDFIQWNPECAQSDPELSYTLRPGTCTFSNPGYRNEYRINSLGVRDDEGSLVQPDIVVVGDSHTMGLGVEQEETFSNQLEKMLNVKVLNTGISSYGTARELGILQRVDRSRARYLLIQYCSNDFDENREFIESGGRLPARDGDWFDAQVESNERRRRYYPGKFTDSLLGFVWERVGARLYAREPSPEQSDAALKYFIDVIERHPIDVSGMQIIIFQMELLEEPEGWNPSRLKQRLADDSNSDRLRGVQFVDVMTGLGPEHYLPLDGHMNRMGHRQVAERLAAVIR